MSDPVQLGPFTLGDQIGEGGMGTVYRGLHRKTDLPVALKVIRQATEGPVREYFKREVQAHAGLLHPGIVYLFEYGDVDAAAADASGGKVREGQPYVAMELADQGTLRDVMPVSNWQTVCRLLVQILDALAYAHARGVIHRDLKPENFLIFRRDRHDADRARPRQAARTKLADFGVAHAFRQERNVDTDELQSAAGTPMYMAPEQFRGHWRKYGPWTDLYAVGCIAFELVCGHPPITGEDIYAMAMKHEKESRPALDPNFPVPDELESWIHRAMTPDPLHRFRRAADAVWTLPRGVLADYDPEADDLLDEPNTTSAATDPTAAAWEPTTPGIVTTVALGNDLTESADLPVPDTDPDDRPETEQQTALALQTLVSLHPPVPDDWRPEQTDPLPAPLVGAGLGLFGLRDPPFVNRRRECDYVWQALQRVVERGVPEFVFVAGEAGTGKSRLAEWMTTRAHEVGAAGIMRAVHTEGGGPTDGLPGAFERILRTVKMDRDEVYDHLLETLPPLDDDEDDDDLRERDARALTEYLRPTDDDADAIDGPRYAFANARQKRGLVVRVLRRLADRRTLVLWLDDLQWGSEAVGLLEHIRETAAETPGLLVLGTLRSDRLAEKPELEERIGALTAEGPSARMDLDPLSRSHQRELLDGLLPLEDTLADELAARTEGHPLFAMQLLGHWIEAGDLTVGDDGFRVPHDREVALPNDIHELWMERIDRLLDVLTEPPGSEARESLELAAALGREVDADEWEALLADADRSPPPALVDRLVERGLAEWTTEGWAFAHGLLVDSLEREAREAGRWHQHHRRCARCLEAANDDARPGPRERIAEHWIAAGEPARALEPLLAESRLAGKRGEDEEAERLLARRAELLGELDLEPDDSRRLEQRLESARLAANGGDLEQARDLYTAVWNALTPEDARLRARAADQLSAVEMRLGHPDEGQSWGEKALGASNRSASRRLQARCRRRLALNAFFEADLDRAQLHARKAEALAEEGSHEYDRLDALRLRAYVRETRGDNAAGELFKRVRRGAAEAGFVVLESQALNGLGEHTRFAGRLDEARRYYRSYLAKLKELSRPTKKAVAERNLAQVELRTGNFDRALEHLRTTEAILADAGLEGSREDLLHLVRLAHAAGVRDAARFDELWTRLADGWPEDWRLIKDHPWLLETAGAEAHEAGWNAKAKDVWRLARDLWERLGNEEAAKRVGERLTED